MNLEYGDKWRLNMYEKLKEMKETCNSLNELHHSLNKILQETDFEINIIEAHVLNKKIEYESNTEENSLKKEKLRKKIEEVEQKIKEEKKQNDSVEKDIKKEIVLLEEEDCMLQNNQKELKGEYEKVLKIFNESLIIKNIICNNLTEIKDKTVKTELEICDLSKEIDEDKKSFDKDIAEKSLENERILSE